MWVAVFSAERCCNLLRRARPGSTGEGVAKSTAFQSPMEYRRGACLDFPRGGGSLGLLGERGEHQFFTFWQARKWGGLNT
jgi:hypothetical protein